MTAQPKVHFSYEPDRPQLEGFATALIQDLGQVAANDADIIVAIGGDGSLVHAFKNANNGQKVFGLLPPDSNSTGFWVNRGATDADTLLSQLSAANGFKISPLKAEMFFKDGTSQTLQAFNEFSPNADSIVGQAMLVNLSINLSGKVIGPIRIMGDGLIFSSAYGSTGLNTSYYGPAIDIRHTGIVLSGKGINHPKRGFDSIVATEETVFELEFPSPHKRPVSVLYDGLSIGRDREISRAVISKDHDSCVELLLTNDPATRVFSSLMPTNI